MKINLSSFVTKLLLLNLLTIFVANKDDPEPESHHQKNQLFTYPNTYEAPTTHEQLEHNKYSAPKLSMALDEMDPNKKLKKSEFLDIVNFAQYKVTRGESDQIFYFADQNRDDLLDNREWTEFKALFLLPFEACNPSGTYLLDKEELKNCFEADPRSSFVIFRRRYNLEDKKYDLMRELISSRAGGDLNFADYLFIRRALFGWKECYSTPEYISKRQFKCAIAAALPHKYYTQLDTDIIYDAGLRVFGDKALIQNDFVSYLGILYYVNIFGAINQPVHSSFLEKSQWIKSIREDRLPNNFEEQEVEDIFDIIAGNPYIGAKKVTVIDFPSWIWFFNINRIFNIYSSTRPTQINFEEFNHMLDNTFIQRDIVVAIDFSLTRFSQQQYQEASLIIQRLRPHEKSFFFSFKQDASRASNFSFNNDTVNTFYHEIVPNETNREVFFSTMTQVDKQYISRTQLYRAFHMANFWVALSGYPKMALPPVMNIEYIQTKSQELYESVRPPVSMKQRTNAGLYKLIPNELKIDLLTYMAIESFYWKAKVPSNLSSRNIITETDVRVILRDYGMEHMPETVLDSAMKGVDSLRRREYIPTQVIKNVITVHAVAAEQLRDKMQIEQLGIKNTTEPSRIYPQPDRRFLSSPLV